MIENTEEMLEMFECKSLTHISIRTHAQGCHNDSWCSAGPNQIHLSIPTISTQCLSNINHNATLLPTWPYKKNSMLQPSHPLPYHPFLRCVIVIQPQFLSTLSLLPPLSKMPPSVLIDLGGNLDILTVRMVVSGGEVNGFGKLGRCINKGDLIFHHVHHLVKLDWKREE